MKLELKHLAPYFPYDLKCMVNEGYYGWPYTLEGIDSNGDCYTENGDHNICDIKPMLRPLSELTKEIEHNEKTFVPVKEFINIIGSEISDWDWNWLEALEDDPEIINDLIDKCPFQMIECFFEWHFDVFGLIDAGLAIDINTLKETK